MNLSNDYLRRGRHCVFKMHVHLVFVTKYRLEVFSDSIIDSLEKIFSKICINMDARLIECNGEKNHIHLLVEFPPKLAISKLVNSLKGASSYRIKKTYPKLKKYYWKNSLWSPSYFARSCGGVPLSIVKQYVKKQRLSSSP
jgi:putative transposase